MKLQLVHKGLEFHGQAACGFSRWTVLHAFGFSYLLLKQKMQRISGIIEQI